MKLGFAIWFVQAKKKKKKKDCLLANHAGKKAPSSMLSDAEDHCSGTEHRDESRMISH
jgi:hypothetical protein